MRKSRPDPSEVWQAESGRPAAAVHAGEPSAVPSVMAMCQSDLTLLLESIEARVAKDFPEMTVLPPRPVVSAAERLQAARRLREALCSVPFYAKGAETARLRGDEMAYWLRLQSSEMMLRRGRRGAVQPRSVR